MSLSVKTKTDYMKELILFVHFIIPAGSLSPCVLSFAGGLRTAGLNSTGPVEDILDKHCWKCNMRQTAQQFAKSSPTKLVEGVLLFGMQI